MIKYENVSLSFDGRKILNNFSLAVGKSEKVIITGRSGTGKTSLFRLLLGLAKPDSGKIYFMDSPLDNKSIWNVRRRTAYVSQDLCIGHNTVKDLFDTILSFKSNSADTPMPRVEELMNYFELHSAALDKRIGDLSGGEKQRIAIIQAVLLDRKIFLLDEITSGLDGKLKLKTTEYFLSRQDWTILCISHDKIETNNHVRFIDMEERK